jgi:multiple sugar transport system substrate-binding protein
MNSEHRLHIAVRKFPPFESAICKQWDVFEAQEHTGLTLDAQAFDLHPLAETLFDRQGLLRGEWDIAFLNTDWMASAHESRAVLNLAPLIEKDPPAGYPDAWTASVLRLQNVDGYILGLPYHDGPECLIYRKDLFESAKEQQAYNARFGRPLSVPKTWSDFEQISRFFHRPDEGLYGSVFAGFPDGHNTVYDFLIQLWTRGGELVDGARNICFETEAAAEGLAFYRQLLQSGSATHPNSSQMDSVKSGLAFVNGEVAMMVNWFGFAAMAETFEQSRVKGCVDIADVPCTETGSPVSLNVYWILSIAAGSRHPEVAYNFLRHCATAPMDKLLTLEGGTGCRKSTWNDPDVNRIIPFYNRLEALHRNARELPRMAQWPHVAAIIDEISTAVIHSGKPITEILHAAQTKIQECR